jgi:hypothetical protein
MIRVTMWPSSVHHSSVREFDNSLVPKVLQSGALKMVRLVEAEIPPLGTKDEDIVKPEEVVVAVFNGEYLMERTDDE